MGTYLIAQAGGQGCIVSKWYCSLEVHKNGSFLHYSTYRLQKKKNFPCLQYLLGTARSGTVSLTTAATLPVTQTALQAHYYLL